MKQTKKVTINELAKYKIGSVLHWVVLRPNSVIQIEGEDEWMLSVEVHPKVIYERKSIIFAGGEQLPRLHASDFRDIMNILNTNVCIEELVVNDINRSTHTGEFHYQSSNLLEWVPESSLFQNREEAEREKKRILGMFRRWSVHGTLNKAG